MVMVIYGLLLVVGPVWPSSGFPAKGRQADLADLADLADMPANAGASAGTKRSLLWDYDLNLKQAATALFRLDAEKGKVMLQESLPVTGHGELEVPARFGWRHTLRSYIYMILGFDINQPRSLITASLPEKTVQKVERYVPGGGDNGSGNWGWYGDGYGDGYGQSNLTNAYALPYGHLHQESQAVQEQDGDQEQWGGNGVVEPGQGLMGAGSGAGVGSGVGAGVGAGVGVPEWTTGGSSRLLAALQQRQWGREPLVLIYHTHTSEMYDCRDTDLAVTSHVFNSTDTGVVRVGEELALHLSRRYNIPVIHSKTIHDFPSFAQAYANSAKNVAAILKKYPSIQVVLDIHRDGAENVSFSRELNGLRMSQVMLVLTRPESYKVSLHPDWWKNMYFGKTMAQKMEEIHPGLLRRVLEVGNTRYNQHLHPNMVLLEVGNYLDKEEEALNSARLLADVVAAMLAEVLDPAYETALLTKNPYARPAAAQVQVQAAGVGGGGGTAAGSGGTGAGAGAGASGNRVGAGVQTAAGADAEGKKPVTPPILKPIPSALPTTSSSRSEGAGAEAGVIQVEPPTGKQVQPPAAPRPAASRPR
ncbi:MAG TPA: hypothetical protein GXX29_12335 [Firmicutes bacterium]|nr:hypothetical protein [Bacillota bacterium]